jgi:serine/threonine-protein kinase
VVDRKVGAGGMGTVYLARHEATGLQAAVKILAPSLAHEPGLVARFMREIDAMRKLKNPHVVELFDHGVDGEVYYYAMEYVEGETLTARLRRDKRLNWRDVIDFSTQISLALKAAHDAGIIHRDLKPSNLLLTTDGRIKLTDFGVAQVFAGSKLTVTGGIIGTAEFMSPEQGKGGRITKRSDLYALGAVMYVMLTGRPPFSGKTTLDVIHKHNYSQFDRPRLVVPEIPLLLDEVVCQLMQKDPDKRFADAYVVYRKLQEVLRRTELATGRLVLDSDKTQTDRSTVDSAAVRMHGTGPGAGTLMRDLFRAQMEVDNTHSGVRRFFEKTWVLVGLLVLLVGGLGYWMQSVKLSPQQRFETGVALLENDPLANWQTVRDDYFVPLIEQNPAEWDAKLEPYLEWIRLEEQKESFSGKRRGRGSRRRPDPSTEIERILRRAQHDQDDGDVTEAERTLVALESLLAGDPQHATERKLVEGYLSDLRARHGDQSADRKFVDAALDRAEKGFADGKKDEAVRIWKSVIELYGNDSYASAQVERARRHLAGLTVKATP